MDRERLREVLEAVQSGKYTPKEALDLIKILPYENLGFARVDHHRALRNGRPEVIFAQNKTPEQVAQIAVSLYRAGSPVLATRASREAFQAVKAAFTSPEWADRPGRLPPPGPEPMAKDAGAGGTANGSPKADKAPASPPEPQYHELARIITVPGKEGPAPGGSILVLSAGTADLPVAEEAAISAEFLGHQVKRGYDVGVAGLHRLLDMGSEIQKAQVIIVVAGMEGALASVVGGMASAPVVAVPTSVGYGAHFQGLASLLTMLNSCATGIGVVNIDNGFGAAMLADAIIATAQRWSATQAQAQAPSRD